MGLSAENLAVTRAGRHIFTDVSISAEAGDITALVGPSGCGKTTLLSCLGLLLRPDSGTVVVDGVSTQKWSSRRVARWWHEDAAFVYQDSGVIDEKDVGYNVTLASNLWGRTKIDDGALDMLKNVGLADRVREKAAVLSGGEKQRLGIARALYRRASFIFADEPTASLDAANRQSVSDLLRRAADTGACVITATHDDGLAARADRVIALAPAS
ncbi:ATP-binding cassette domain-containing protein [Nanchangia anserum]|uniref:ATP-binding cassette domain-containing protein n=1 Tax=Nanchangia anserum TaxID=2692125 RepID=A0A8I0KR89_9ACTO|nr:ATP-binding cassette domain-containing protein [Nanchangia anserum]MBD3689197.1 ATP-binding cassette domain-containing protein [Nanchangia anserum]QOX81423.1 ATP-binding cassette domain-containing protein [Nanchangia anserum]